MVMESETPYLPQYIITYILQRLPVKSLIRFQYVCKDWKNLFKARSFIAEQLHHSTQQNPLLIADCHITECNSNPWHLCLLNREMQVLEFHNAPISDPLLVSWRHILSSNGLLCVLFIMDDGSESFWLWNPSDREVQQVPKYSQYSLDNYGTDNYFAGFGFSPIVDDYKIVKLFTIALDVEEVEVYALSTGLWTKVELGNLKGPSLMSNYGVSFNGSLFWLGLNKGSEIDWIVSFDIPLEVFTLIPFPNTTSHVLESMYYELTTYDNKLALLVVHNS